MMWEDWSGFAKKRSLLAKPRRARLAESGARARFCFLRLWFEEELDVSIYELDFHSLINEDDPGEAFLPLREQERFRLVEGDYALIWLNSETGAYDEKAIDLAPECVRFFCERYGKKLKGLGLALVDAHEQLTTSV